MRSILFEGLLQHEPDILACLINFTKLSKFDI